MKLRNILILIPIMLFLMCENTFAKSRMPRIIGGKVSSSSEIPWQAHIYMYNKKGEAFTCGGSLISTSFILTAAHCLVDYEIFEIILGQNKTDQKIYLVGQNDVFAHGYYNKEDQYDYDIGLIKLPIPAVLSDDIDIVELPSFSDVKKNYGHSYVITSGWGRTSPTPHSESRSLKVLLMEVIPYKQCPIKFKTKICATGEELDTICKGDSGGPLVIYDEHKGPVLIGVTSIVFKQCRYGLPAYFTRVSLFLNWIHFYTRIPISD